MYKLRDYQQTCVDIGTEFMQQTGKDSGVIVAPTAAGKSLLIGNISANIGKPCIVLQPSVELLYQNYEKAISYGAKPTIYSASAGKKEMGRLTYATLGSIIKETDTIRRMGIKHLMVDECEKGYPPEEGSMFWKFIDGTCIERILGFTATPFRLKRYGNKDVNWSQLNLIISTRPRIFNKFLYIVQIQEMVERGFWCDIEYQVWRFDGSCLRVNSSGAEYTDESISKAVQINKTNEKIFLHIIRLVQEGKRSILVFLDSLKSCYNMRLRLEEADISVGLIEGGMAKKARENVVADFKGYKIKVLLNYSAVLQGFDHPGIDCVIFGRPTMSLNVWVQALGRGVRILPGGRDKKCLMLDCCGNYFKFGRLEDLKIGHIGDSKVWRAYSRDKVLTGHNLEQELTVGDLLYNESEKIMEYLRPQKYADEIFPWKGKYEGRKFSSIPYEGLRELRDCDLRLYQHHQKMISEYINQWLINIRNNFDKLRGLDKWKH